MHRERFSLSHTLTINRSVILSRSYSSSSISLRFYILFCLFIFITDVLLARPLRYSSLDLYVYSILLLFFTSPLITALVSPTQEEIRCLTKACLSRKIYIRFLKNRSYSTLHALFDIIQWIFTFLLISWQAA